MDILVKRHPINFKILKSNSEKNNSHSVFWMYQMFWNTLFGQRNCVTTVQLMCYIDGAKCPLTSAWQPLDPFLISPREMSLW